MTMRKTVLAIWFAAVGMAAGCGTLEKHEGNPVLGDETSSAALPDTRALLSTYVKRFNAKDDELYVNAISNAAAANFLSANIPRFACPNKDIERT